jgi:hypothetical protein
MDEEEETATNERLVPLKEIPEIFKGPTSDSIISPANIENPEITVPNPGYSVLGPQEGNPEIQHINWVAYYNGESKNTLWPGRAKVIDAGPT